MQFLKIVCFYVWVPIIYLYITENKPHLYGTSGTVTIETYIIVVLGSFSCSKWSVLCLLIPKYWHSRWAQNFFLQELNFLSKLSQKFYRIWIFPKTLSKFYPNFHIFKLFEPRKWKVSLLLKDYCEPSLVRSLRSAVLNYT